MARHFAPSEKKKLPIPSLDLSALPRLLTWERRGRPAQIRYERIFSVREMMFLLAATLLFIFGILFRLPRWAEIVVFGLSAVLAGFGSLRRQMRRVAAKKWPDEDVFVFLTVIASFSVFRRIATFSSAS